MHLFMTMSWITNSSMKTSENAARKLENFMVTSEPKRQYSALDAVSLPMIRSIRVVHNHFHTRKDNYSFNPSAILAFFQANHGWNIYRWDGIQDDWPLTWRTRKTKDELLERAKEIYPNPVYKLQMIADKFTKGSFRIKILFLLVAFPELNPIEMFWSKLKRHIATTNITFRLSSVEQLTQEVVESFTAL